MAAASSCLPDGQLCRRNWPETDASISDDSLYMVDSGGQYLGGTTDITRTFHYGTPTPEQVTRYTTVLKGAIGLALVVVPDKTLDTAVDLATRQFLFSQGLDYRHGTGGWYHCHTVSVMTPMSQVTVSEHISRFTRVLSWSG